MKRLMRKDHYLYMALGWVLVSSGSLFSQVMPPSIEESAKESVVYVGDRVPDPHFFDGKLPHAVGVHHYQVYRANRSQPLEGDKMGWTYNHQPFLAYWNGKFYVQYLSDLFQEHTPPGKTLLVVSEDGRHWGNPEVIFPEYSLPEINFKGMHVGAGTKSVMHQRMGFYVAPNGKLLTLAFYSYCPTPRTSPNAGTGLGRVVREINKDGSFGPIYFIRYNRHAGWNEKNTNYPYYKTSKDKGFLEACEALLNDKLMTLQWWEEDRAEDGFYTINPGDVKNSHYFAADIVTSKGSGKAFNYYHRPDGVVVGLWKNQYAALSPDDGKTWTKITKNRTLMTDGAKTWGQRTDDGKYVIIHNQSATFRNRYPMTSMTSEDGHSFDDLLCLRNDIPFRRYQGIHKRFGSQYYRGIIEGNGDPPGDDVWVVYSVNKEDIWIAKIATPITGEEKDDLIQDFEGVRSIMELTRWNLYEPAWAPITIGKDPLDASNNCLKLMDEEPVDYARAERVFPERDKFTLRFRVNPMQIPMGYAMDIEVQEKHGVRPMKIRLDKDWISFDHMKTEVPVPVPITLGQWHEFELIFNCADQSYAVKLNGKLIGDKIPFAYKVEKLQRLVFRTGPYRGEVPPVVFNEAVTNPAGLNTEDVPGTEKKVKAGIYFIDDILTKEK